MGARSLRQSQKARLAHCSGLNDEGLFFGPSLLMETGLRGAAPSPAQSLSQALWFPRGASFGGARKRGFGGKASAFGALRRFEVRAREPSPRMMMPVRLSGRFKC